MKVKCKQKCLKNNETCVQWGNIYYKEGERKK